MKVIAESFSEFLKSKSKNSNVSIKDISVKKKLNESSRKSSSKQIINKKEKEDKPKNIYSQILQKIK